MGIFDHQRKSKSSKDDVQKPAQDGAETPNDGGEGTNTPAGSDQQPNTGSGETDAISNEAADAEQQPEAQPEATREPVINARLLEAMKRDGTFKYNVQKDSWSCELTNDQMRRLTK